MGDNFFIFFLRFLNKILLKKKVFGLTLENNVFFFPPVKYLNILQFTKTFVDNLRVLFYQKI